MPIRDVRKDETEEEKKAREEAEAAEKEKQEKKAREEAEAAEKEKQEKKEKFFKLGKEVIRPYRGKSELPLEKLNKKGKVVKSGEPRHFLARQGNAYKLIRVYRANGIKRSLVRMIKPYIKEKPQEKALLQQLKKMEIPGAI